ncbi:hypothetical protein Arub01_44030 [Actinomadura rubrobrunea]|uniref:Toxin-antitoxin system HicB family antitoxin n=1 Tax=Actinomadura rubrobrunea TaxID=115335 RepID=A0A9W6Q030_9ACTN|nr:hypothetical protein [Actinomadura rubrobrunea]GLW66159.1 hypothetical protein Arub01_44030 [Actinomadura rubrobrunea]
MTERKKILLRLDPAVHDALARWASDELRSTNAQIEFLLRKALADAGRMPRGAARMRRPGRPRKNADDTGRKDDDTGRKDEDTGRKDED